MESEDSEVIERKLGAIGKALGKGAKTKAKKAAKDKLESEKQKAKKKLEDKLGEFEDDLKEKAKEKVEEKLNGKKADPEGEGEDGDEDKDKVDPLDTETFSQLAQEKAQSYLGALGLGDNDESEEKDSDGEGPDWFSWYSSDDEGENDVDKNSIEMIWNGGKDWQLKGDAEEPEDDRDKKKDRLANMTAEERGRIKWEPSRWVSMTVNFKNFDDGGMWEKRNDMSQMYGGGNEHEFDDDFDDEIEKFKADQDLSHLPWWKQWIETKKREEKKRKESGDDPNELPDYADILGIDDEDDDEDEDDEDGTEDEPSTDKTDTDNTETLENEPSDKSTSDKDKTTDELLTDKTKKDTTETLENEPSEESITDKDNTKDEPSTTATDTIDSEGEKSGPSTVLTGDEPLSDEDIGEESQDEGSGSTWESFFKPVKTSKYDVNDNEYDYMEGLELPDFDNFKKIKAKKKKAKEIDEVEGPEIIGGEDSENEEEW